MGTRVFVACEDPLLDQYVAVPVVTAIFRQGLGRAQAKVRAITNPRIRGIENLLDSVPSLVTRYAPLGTCVVFVADLDCQDGGDGRGDRFHAFQSRLEQLPPHLREKTSVVLAVQELEVWALWGSRSLLDDDWSVVRAERDPKETHFDTLVRSEDRLALGKGRSRLVKLSLDAGWHSLRAGCPELAQAEADLRSRGL